jgi:hypothetical protein
MKNKLTRVFVALALLALSTLNSQLSSARAQGTAFTYQGHLVSGANAANGNFDLTFELFTAASGGSQTGATLTNLDVGVTNGLFTVTTDFGAVYNGAAYWLQIAVRTNGGSTFTPLSPLQELTPTPYAITAENVTGAIPLAQLPAGLVTNNETGVTLDNVTVGGTLTLPAPTSIYSENGILLYADLNYNFFTGPYAGENSVNETNSTASTGVGFGALYYDGGSNNTAFGANALFFTAGGNNNTGTGAYALSSYYSPGDLTGNYNTADGAYALALDEAGYNNTGVGYQALANDETGFYNTALGFNAGMNITGSSNIDIGHPGVSSDNMVIRIGNGQTETYIAGVINGNGAGLTNLPGGNSLLDSPGNQNFFAGPSAGNATMTGPYNTGVGDGVLAANTTGGDNTAVGVYALENNTNGSANTALGADVLAYNTSGSDNTALGLGALEYNSTGSDNTAIGFGSLLYSSTGGHNTATGYYALSAYDGSLYVTGSANTADGSYALASEGSGYNNTAMGYQSLYANTSGVDNVAVGVAAFQDEYLGSENTAIGTYAFQFFTNGSGNVGLGYAAGYDLDSGSDNIYIGSYGVQGDNNVVRIGQSPAATYINGTSTYITGTLYPNTIALEGSDNNGLVYTANSGLPGINFSQGPFLYGYDGGALGTVSPLGVNLSWDYSGDIWVSNNCSVGTLTIRGGSDLAEPFKISSGNDEVPEGSVMVIDEQSPGRLKVSSQPYDTRVAGILSGANGIHPGIQMQQEGSLDGGRNVALSGRVYVQADTSNGPINPGDLLTTSSAPGRAMKVTDHLRAQGAILGKAMSGLSEGNGMVLVLVTLQ